MYVIYTFLNYFLTTAAGKWIIDSSTNTDNSILKYITNTFPSAVTTVCQPSIVSKIDGIITPIAILIMSIFFFVDLLSKSVSANFTTEVFIRSFIKYIIGFALVTNANKLGGGIVSFGDALVAEITSKISPVDVLNDLQTAKLNSYMKSHLAELMILGNSVVSKLIIKWIANLLITTLMQLMVSIVAYMRAIQIFIYRALLPMAVADIFGGGIYKGAGKHIKRLLGLALQYPMVYIIAVLYSLFTNAINVLTPSTNSVAMLGQMLMIMIVTITTIRNSAEEAKSIIK